jgi:hypothetical protein
MNPYGIQRKNSNINQEEPVYKIMQQNQKPQSQQNQNWNDYLPKTRALEINRNSYHRSEQENQNQHQRSYSRSPQHEERNPFETKRYFVEDRERERGETYRSPNQHRDSFSLAFEKASRDEIPKTRVINHPTSRRVLEKSFVSPTKGTDEVRRDYYRDYDYRSNSQNKNVYDAQRNFESPSQRKREDLNRHVRSF